MPKQSQTKFFEISGDWFKPTDRRPTPREWTALERDIKFSQERAHKHKPGDGSHPVPGNADVCWNGVYWFVDHPTSRGAVLCHVQDLCAVFGLDYVELHRAAYPYDEVFVPDGHDRAACAHPAHRQDLAAVLADLSDIRCHSLRRVLEHQTGGNHERHSIYS